MPSISWLSFARWSRSAANTPCCDLRGCRIGEAHAKDLAWFDPAGGEMTDVSWHAKVGRCVGMRLDADAMATDDVEGQGQQTLDDTVLVLFNAGRTPVDFSLPEPTGGGSWRLVFDTADEPQC